MLTSLTPTQKVVLALALGVLVVGVVLIAAGKSGRTDSEGEDVRYEAGPPEPTEIRVHVTGEVVRPGVYSLPLDARVEDAVRAAGGFTERARQGSLNLAAFVEDGDQVYVEAEPPPPEPSPLTGDEPRDERPSTPPAPPTATAQPPTRPAASAPDTPARPQRVRLNSAGLEELQRIPGVGPEMAQRILYYRHEHGKFRSFEDLAKVEGIGPKTIEKIRVAATLN